MKKLIMFLVAAAMLMSACGNGGKTDGSSSSNSQGNSGSSVSEPEGSESTPDAVENSAFKIIDGFEDMPDDAILGVKYYYYDMRWMEANKLPHLDRYTPMEPENHYFMVVPRYAGASVKVQTVRFDEKSKEFVAGEVTYQKDNIPDGYALIINDLTEAGGPKKLVTVSYDGREGSCDFTVYNYSGEHESPWYKSGAYMIEAEPRD